MFAGAAASALAHHLVSEAEVRCRQALGEDPTNADANAVLAQLSLVWNLRDWAKDYADRAIAVNAYHKPARRVLDELAKPFESPPGGQKYLVIKCWGTGFWSDMRHVMGQLVLAELSGRTPIVHWGERCLFAPWSVPGPNIAEKPKGEVAADGAWGFFYEPVSNVRLADIAGRGLRMYPPCWSDENIWLEQNIDRAKGLTAPWDLYCLNRPEAIVVSNIPINLWDIAQWIRPGQPYFGLSPEALFCEAMKKWLKPVPEVRAAIEEFCTRHGIGDAAHPTVALHMRGTDKVLEDVEIAAHNTKLIALTDATLRSTPTARVFLLTDTEKTVSTLRARWGADRVLATDCIRSGDKEAVHFTRREEAFDSSRLGREVMIDAGIAARCDGFYGLARSNVSCVIASMKHWTPGSVNLLGKSLHEPMNIAMLPVPSAAKRATP
jgi:protein O-GlcNAc transferase